MRILINTASAKTGNATAKTIVKRWSKRQAMMDAPTNKSGDISIIRKTVWNTF